jgi:membrane-associated phospholipid phosphatase
MDSMSRILAARTLSVVGHPALLMPGAIALGATNAKVPPQLMQAALASATLVAVIVCLFSLRQVRSGRWAHVDASHPRERVQLNLFLTVLLFGAAALLWSLDQPQSVVAGAALAGTLVAAAHLLRRWLKVSLHAAFAVFAAALVWPGVASVSLMLALAAGVAWSRLVLQRHTLAEVVVGLLLGSASGLVLNLAVR